MRLEYASLSLSDFVPGFDIENGIFLHLLCKQQLPVVCPFRLGLPPAFL